MSWRTQHMQFGTGILSLSTKILCTIKGEISTLWFSKQAGTQGVSFLAFFVEYHWVWLVASAIWIQFEMLTNNCTKPFSR